MQKPEELGDRKGSFKMETVTPVDRVMAELPGVYYRLSEVAEMVGVHHKTLRRLIRKGVTKAPSKQFTRGGMRMYLYTPEDIEELKEHFKKGPDGEDQK